MSWAQQREQIRRAAQAGVRPRTSGLGSQILPLRGPGGQSAQLTRPNGALTRAGQFYYQLAGRQPPSRQFDDSQPLIREGASRSWCARWCRTATTTSRSWARPSSRRSTPSGWPTCRCGSAAAARTAGAMSGVARNVQQAVLQKLGSPSEDDAIMELSEEVYFLDGSREWTLSSQTTQHVDNRTLVETSLRQPLGALREVSYQLFKGDEILASAFERRDDQLCAARQLAELLRLPLEEVLSDFDTICDRGWQERGITPEEIRKFCVWRGAPMLFVNCQGQLLDSYQPAVKEARAVAFTVWEGHAFFYKNARSVFQCDDAERLRPRFRSERWESAVPEFGNWREWDGELRAGHFWTRDLGALLAAGHCPKVEFVRVAQLAAVGGGGGLRHLRAA